MSPPCSLLRRYILLCHGCRRHRILLAQCGSTKEFSCNTVQWRIHHLTRGEETLEDMCLSGCHDQCMTDWALTNQVRCNSLHRSDRLPTGCWHFLSRYQVLCSRQRSQKCSLAFLCVITRNEGANHPSNCTKGTSLSWYSLYDYRRICKRTDIPL